MVLDRDMESRKSYIQTIDYCHGLITANDIE